MVQLSILSQAEQRERVNVIPHVPCWYAAGLSSSFKNISSATGLPIIVTADCKFPRGYSIMSQEMFQCVHKDQGTDH